MSKHISKTMEWDEVVHLATAAYNFFQMNIQEKVHSFLCLAEILESH